MAAKKKSRRPKRWRAPKRMTLEGPPIARRKDLVVPEVLTLEPHDAWRENRGRMAILLVAFLVLCAGWGTLVGLYAGIVWAGLPVAVGLGLVYLVVGARYGDGWMQRVLGAEEQGSERVRNTLRGVTGSAGVPAPDLRVSPGAEPNAVALGLRRRWVVITSGAAELDRLELEALLAHEVCHLRDGDGALAAAFVLLAGAPELGTKSLGSRGGPLALVALPLWPVCLLLRLSSYVLFPAEREHRADVCGALLTRYPPGMHRLLSRAAGEHENSPLRASDPFWFAPRRPVSGPGVAERADRIAEM